MDFEVRILMQLWNLRHNIGNWFFKVTSVVLQCRCAMTNSRTRVSWKIILRSASYRKKNRKLKQVSTKVASF